MPSSNLSVTYLLSEMLKLLTLLPLRTAAYAIRKGKQPKFGLREEEFVQNYHHPATTALCYDCLLLEYRRTTHLRWFILVFTVQLELQNIQSKHNFLFPKEIRSDYTYVFNPSLLEL